MHGLRGSLRVSAVVLFSVLVAPVAPVQAQTLTVFAAASMADALGEILRHYDPGRGTRIVASYGASSTLSRQIERGAPADVFVSADQAWMDYLAKAARIDPTTRTVLVG
ncbi:MAG: molybdate ABC transporter substrate-binding protein, partial [Betaproteobacteria bacterium]